MAAGTSTATGCKIYFKVSIKSINKANESRQIIPMVPLATLGESLAATMQTVDQPIDVVKVGAGTSADEFVCNLDTPVHEISALGYNSVTVWLKSKEEHVDKNNNTLDVFSIMKQASRSYTSLPKQREEQTQKDVLFNKVTNMMKNNKIGFTPIQVETHGKAVVSTLTSVLWFMDGRHDRFESRSVRLPEMFLTLRGFRSYKQQHQKIPEITKADVNENIDRLGEVLLMPCMLHRTFREFREAVSNLLEGLKQYHRYLDIANKNMHHNHLNPEPVRNLMDNWSISFVKGQTAHEVKSEYKSLIQRMEGVGLYEPVDTCDLEPDCKEERRKWLSSLVLPFSVSKFTYHYGNYLGNLNVLWKIENHDSERSLKESRVVQAILASVQKFKTRQMQKEFIDRYFKVAKPVFLRNMYTYLTDYEYSPENDNQRAIDMRLCQFLVETENLDIMVDLRKNNGKSDTKFETFWTGLDKFLDEKTAVHERRTKDINYMPFAMSVEDLREEIRSRLPSDAEIPSVSWIKLNFYPGNGFKHSAINYTGKFKVRMKVQQRLLRSTHEDSEFARNQFSLLKHFACKFQEHASFQSMDDKAIVPIGEPGQAISTGVRPHHGGIVTGDRQNMAMDHDFHIAGLIPSVCFLINIPENPCDSFYSGTVHVTVKDKVFQHSTPLRHSTETVQLLRNYVSDDNVEVNKPIVIRYTDGGPDHRVTYRSVQLSALCEFVALNLDFMVCARTAPAMSYTNPAERIMSLLNIALQNVALQRKRMLPEYEMMARSKTLKGLRNQAERSELFKQNYIESTEEPISVIKQRFAKLKWKGEQVLVHDAADTESMEQLLSMLKLIDGDLDLSVETHLTKLKSSRIDKFLNSHSRSRHYMFQIKKCTDEQCMYCSCNPPRVPMDVFEQLHWVPDCTPDDKNGFKSFENLYGEETTDEGRPSLTHKPANTERDKKFKNLLVGTKVRGFVVCCECAKRRVVYGAKRLTKEQETLLKRVREELLYTCGSLLFPGGDLQDVLVVKEAMTCSMLIEITYYAGKSMSFDPVCIHCGSLEVTENDRVLQLKEQFGTVRPICGQCLESGKDIITRNALKVKKK